VCGVQFGRTSAPTPPHLVQAMRAPNDRTAVSSGPRRGNRPARRGNCGCGCGKRKTCLYQHHVGKRRRAGGPSNSLMSGEGEKPQTKYEMVVNLKTAKALGIEPPTAILLRANEVIE
jgi:hypothetical protein